MYKEIRVRNNVSQVGGGLRKRQWIKKIKSLGS